MKIHAAVRYCVSFLLLILFMPFSIFAQIQLSDPGIPEKEHLVYRERIGERTQQLIVETQKVQMDGRIVFEVSGHSPTSDSRMLIDSSSMVCFFSEMLDRYADSTIKRITEIRDIKYKPKPDELVIADFNSLYFMLRGFPWTSTKAAKLYFLGSGGTGSASGSENTSGSGPAGSGVSAPPGNSAFLFELKVVGKESIIVNGRSWQCWKVEMGLSGIIGALFKKSNFWYSVDAPCIMVKFEGMQGPPGTPLKTIELISLK